MDTKKPLQKKEVLSQVIGEETMLYNPDKKVVCMLNCSAAFVWNLCDGCRSTKEISELLHDAYEVTEGTDLKNDIGDILGSLAELDLLEQCNL